MSAFWLVQVPSGNTSSRGHPSPETQVPVKWCALETRPTCQESREESTLGLVGVFVDGLHGFLPRVGILSIDQDALHRAQHGAYRTQVNAEHSLHHVRRE